MLSTASHKFRAVSNRCYKNSALAILFCLSTQSSYAVFPWAGGTDGSAAFTGGINSWTGDGTVQANVTDNPALGSTALVIDNFSSGSLSITMLDQARLQATITATIDFMITGGGTADLFFNNRNNYDGGTGTWEGMRLSNFSGTVTGIETVITYDSPIATRNHSPLDNSRPLGAGLAVTALGGTALTDYEVTSSLGGVMSDPTDTDTFVAGLSPAFDTPVLIGGLTGSSGSTIASASGFSAIDQFLIFRGFDDNGNTGGYGTTYRDRTYATSQTWDLTRDGGAAFASGSSFIFSLDGEQYTNYASAAPEVPEPSVTFCAAVGLLALAARRSRKHSG